MPTLFQLGQIISHIPKTNGNPSKFKGSPVSPPCGANSIGGCSTIVGGQIMTIWQASLCFVDYNNFEKHFTFPGRLQFIVCLQLRPPPERKCSDFRILDQIGRIVDLYLPRNDHRSCQPKSI